MDSLVKVGAIITRNNKLLLEKSIDKDRYNIPGGVLEPNESLKKALIRELEEELSVHVSAKDLKILGEFSDYMDSNPRRTVKIIAYLLSPGLYTFKPRNEVEKIVWFSAHELKSIPIGGVLKNKILPFLLDAGILS